MSVKATSSNAEGRIFVALCISYSVIVLLLTLIYAMMVHLAGGMLARILEAIGAGVRRAFRIGGVRLEPETPLDVAAFAVILIPAGVFLCCIVMGPLLGWAESWSVGLGVEYLMSNMLGLTSPLTNVTPTSTIGIALAIVVTILGMLIVTTALGMMTTLVSATRTMKYGDSMASFVFWVLVFVPVLLIVLITAFGGVMAALEKWPYHRGVYFMASQICGFSNALVDADPKTGRGCFAEVLCISFQILVQSIILDIIGSHPVSDRIIQRLQRRGLREHAKRLEATSSPVARSDSDAEAGKGGKAAQALKLASRNDVARTDSDAEEGNGGKAAQAGEGGVEYWKDRAASLQSQLEALQQKMALLEKRQREEGILKPGEVEKGPAGGEQELATVIGKSLKPAPS